jgi:hypothetical protein
MTPAPHLHTADAKGPSSSCIAAEHHLEDEVVSAGGNPALKTPRSYSAVTLSHKLPKT